MTQLRKLFFIAALLITTSSLAQPVASREDMLADLKVFADSLPLLHKNLYARMSKDEFDKSISAIRENETLSYTTLLIDLMKLASRTGDEHMDIRPAQNNVFPFRFDLIGDDVVIVAAANGGTAWLAHRVIAINDVAVTDIKKSFALLTSQENPSSAGNTFVRQLNRPLLLMGMGVIKDMKQATFKLMSPSGETIVAGIQSLEPGQVSGITVAEPLNGLVAYQEQQAYGFQYLRDNKTLYFNYRSCSQRKDLPFEDFNQSMFDIIEKEKPERIVLDLRQNSGGNSSILIPFIKKIRKSDLNKSDRFFVLIGKSVFSSAVMNAVELKRTTHATFVGEETAGNINHYGEIKVMHLRHTGMRVTYSTKYWETWKGHDGGLRPDKEIHLSYEEFLKGIDPVLGYALKKY